MDYAEFEFKYRTLPDVKAGQIASIAKIVLDDNAPVESIFEPNDPLIEPEIMDAWEQKKYFNIACILAYEELGRKLTEENLPQLRHLTIMNMAKFIIVSVISRYKMTTLINTESLIQVNLQIAAILENQNILQIETKIDNKTVIVKESSKKIADILDELEKNSAMLQRIKEQNSEESEVYRNTKQYTDESYTLDNLKIEGI
ncbi:MAG: hypothetical protein SPK70_09745 [Succinivibrio dextrinosolvens]|nr:hypothetical protein [Succinivibrio dextrinosolvens]